MLRFEKKTQFRDKSVSDAADLASGSQHPLRGSNSGDPLPLAGLCGYLKADKHVCRWNPSQKSNQWTESQFLLISPSDERQFSRGVTSCVCVVFHLKDSANAHNRAAAGFPSVGVFPAPTTTTHPKGDNGTSSFADWFPLNLEHDVRTVSISG